MALDAVGEIAVTGFNGDNLASGPQPASTDEISFVILDSIEASVGSPFVIFLNENEFNGATFNTGEGSVTLTITENVAAGTVIRITGLSVSGTTAITNIGTATKTNTVDFAGSNEVVYIYTGTDVNTPTTFFTAVANSGFTGANGPLTGTGLTAGVNALNFTNGVDILAYNGPRDNQTTFAAFGAQLNDTANFITQDGAGNQSNDGTAPDISFSTTAFTLQAPPANGTPGPDTLNGGEGPDTFTGLAGNDTINGNGGDDDLDGGLDNDTINGGAGNDTARYTVGEDGSDTTDLGDGSDVVLVDGNASNVRLTFLSAGVGNGNPLDPAPADGLLNVRFQEETAGVPGGPISRFDDEGITFVATSGQTFDVRDTGGAARGELFEVVALGTAGDDTQTAVQAARPYYFNAGAGNDTITGGTANDFLVGNVGNDTLEGGLGNDTLLGGAGDDTARYTVGEDGTDSSDLGAGNDVVLVDGNASNIRLTFLSAGVGNGNPLDPIAPPGAGDGLLNVRFQEETAGVPGGPVSRFDDEGITFVATSGQTFDVRDTGGAARGELFEVVTLGTSGDDVQTAVQAARPYYFNAGMGNDSITGGTANDFLVGGAGNDTLDGGTGNDTMLGGGGDDNFAVDSLGDVVTEAAASGTDTVTTTLSRYVLGANVENLTGAGGAAQALIGNDAANVITGVGAGDRLFGQGGNDTLNGGALDGQAFGGDGDDTVNGGAGNDVLEGNAGNDTVNGDAGNDNVNGGAGNDILNGGAGNDSVVGADGNDTLDGGTGNDIMVGGLGDDSFAVDSTSDVVIENAGEGTDTVNASTANYTLSANLENFNYTGTGTINAAGNASANVFFANAAAAAVFSGFGGDDDLNGGLGNDTFFGGDGDDMLDGAAGNDVLLGEAGNDTLEGRNGNDNLQGGAGNDTINGGDGNDNIIGQGDDDTLNGGEGDDSISGNDGDDRLDGGLGADLLFGNAGIDILNGDAGDDRLAGGDANDTLNGGDGDDRLNGEAGDDTIDGGDGADRIFDSLGIDSLTGGLGADDFRFTSSAAANGDTVTDFDSGVDVLNFLSFDTDPGTAGVQGVTFTFVGGGAFAGGGQASLRFDDATDTLSGDVDGDGNADFSFTILGEAPVIGDFVLV